jgi:hypothetical protein
VFPRPAEVLKAREGELSNTPLPLLLHALYIEERTCTVELSRRMLQKKILFEDGSAVGCESNLLHETLGKFLVGRGKVTEEQYQACLVESVQTGAQMAEVLIKRSLISPFDLYKQLQANLAHKILDAFRWSDARYKIVGDAPITDSPVRMNTAQLIITGSATALPFDLVTTHLLFADEQRFALMPNPPHAIEGLKPPARHRGAQAHAQRRQAGERAQGQAHLQRAHRAHWPGDGGGVAPAVRGLRAGARRLCGRRGA